MKQTCFFLLLLFAASHTPAQNISINTTGTSNSSLSMLEVLQISATANTKGLFVQHSGAVAGNGYGLWAEKTGASTTNYGGYFSASGASTWNYGAYATTSNAKGYGMEGINTSANNATDGGVGVYGSSNQAMGAGVWGEGNSSTAGVYGSTSSVNEYNAGVYGENFNNTSGTSWTPAQITAGVGGRAIGTANYSSGIYGYNNNFSVNNNAAIFAQDGQNYKAGLVFTYTPGAVQRSMGVYTELLGLDNNDRALEALWNVNNANAPWGIIGAYNNGVYGDCGTVAGGYGVWGNANSSGYGVYGNNNSTGYGGFFTSAGGGSYSATSTPASYYGLVVNGGGAYNSAGASWQASDSRFKKNISPMPEATLEKIMKLNPCQYYYDTEKFPAFRGEEGRKKMGFIAQELETIFPELVNNTKYIPDPTSDSNAASIPSVKGYYAVDYTSLIPVLIKGIQEQQKIIAQLQKELEELYAFTGKKNSYGAKIILPDPAVVYNPATPPITTDTSSPVPNEKISLFKKKER